MPPSGETSLTLAHEALRTSFHRWPDGCASRVDNTGISVSEPFSQRCVGHDSSVLSGSGHHLDLHTDHLPKAARCNESQHQQLTSEQLEEEHAVPDLSALHDSISLVETSLLWTT